MTEVTLQDLIWLAYSEDQNITQEQRDEACNIILSQQKDTSVDFIINLVDLIKLDVDIKTKTQYLLLLYSTIIHTQKFITNDNFGEVFSHMQSVFLYIQDIDNLEENIKDDIAIIFGIVIGEGYLFDKQNTEPQEYVLTLLEEGEISINLIYTLLREMFVWTESVFSYSTDTLINILSREAIYCQKIKLFSAIAAFIPEDSQIHEFFSNLFDDMTEETAATTFKELSFTVKKSPHFFGAHFEKFIQCACNFIVEGNTQTQLNVIDLIDNILKNGRLMCDFEFYRSVADALLQLISDVSDDEPLAIINDESTPYTAAVQCLWDLVSKGSIDSQFNKYIQQKIINIFSDSETENQIAAGFLLAAKSSRVELFEEIMENISEVFYNSENPRLIYAALITLKYCSVNLYFRKLITSDILDYVLSCFISDEVPTDICRISLSVIKKLSKRAYFDHTDGLIHWLISAIEEVSEIETLIAITYLLINNLEICSNSTNYLDSIPSIIEYLLGIENIKIDVAAYSLFNVYVKKIPNSEITEEIQNLLEQGFDFCRDVCNNQDNEIDFKTIFKAQKTYTQLFKHLPADVQIKLVPEILESIAERLTTQIQVNEILDSDVTLKDSYIKVQTENIAVQQYIDKFVFESYDNDWKQLIEVMEILSADAIPEIIQTVSELIHAYIENETRILEFDNSVISVIETITQKAGIQISSEICEMFLDMLEFELKNSDCYYLATQFVDNLAGTFFFSQSRNDHEIFLELVKTAATKIFQTIPSIVANQVKLNEIYSHQTYDIEADDIEVCKNVGTLQYIGELYEKLVFIDHVFAEEIYTTYAETTILKFLNDNTLRIPANMLYLQHQSIVCDEEWLMSEGIQLINQMKDEANDDFGSAVGNMLYSTFAIRGSDFSDECKLQFLNLIFEIVTDYLETQLAMEDSLIFAYAQIAFTLPSYFANPEFASDFFSILPIHFGNYKHIVIVRLVGEFFKNENEYMKDTSNICVWFENIRTLEECSCATQSIEYAIYITINFMRNNNMIQEFYETVQSQYDEELIVFVQKCINRYNQIIQNLIKSQSNE